jgi:hypothetical protein
VIYHIKVKNREKARNDPQAVIYSQVQWKCNLHYFLWQN